MHAMMCCAYILCFDCWCRGVSKQPTFSRPSGFITKKHLCIASDFSPTDSMNSIVHVIIFQQLQVWYCNCSKMDHPIPVNDVCEHVKNENKNITKTVHKHFTSMELNQFDHFVFVSTTNREFLFLQWSNLNNQD